MKIVIDSQAETLSQGEIEHIRFILTLLSSLRGIMLSPVLDVSTIEKPYGGSINSISPEIVKTIMG